MPDLLHGIHCHLTFVPPDIHAAASPAMFKKLLKTHFFNIAFSTFLAIRLLFSVSTDPQANLDRLQSCEACCWLIISNVEKGFMLLNNANHGT